MTETGNESFQMGGSKLGSDLHQIMQFFVNEVLAEVKCSKVKKSSPSANATEFPDP